MALLASVPAFRFDGRPSAARLWDIRFRVAATVALSTSLLAAPAPALVPLGAAVFVLLAQAGSRIGESLRLVWGFSGFLIFFVGLGVLFDPTWQQAGFLGLQALRLSLLLLLGQFLFLTATPTDVTEGIRWYLGFLGPRRAWAAASMAGWALASVPLILDQAQGLLSAAALRGMALRRRPLGVLRLLTLGLLVRTIERSTDMAAALEARGFGSAVPDSRLKARFRDALALAGVVGLCALSWVAGVILGG